MTYEQAVEKAEANKGQTIDITQFHSAKNLVGKTMTSQDPKNTNRIEVIEIVNGNYILRINGNTYNCSPVVYTLQNLRRMKVS
jgi:hypothetical protein